MESHLSAGSCSSLENTKKNGHRPRVNNQALKAWWAWGICFQLVVTWVSPPCLAPGSYPERVRRDQRVKPSGIPTFTEPWWGECSSIVWLHCIVVVVAGPGRCAALTGRLLPQCVTPRRSHHHFLRRVFFSLWSWSLVYRGDFNPCLDN